MGQIKIPTPSSLDLSGKTIIVTGANRDMGLESARQYLVLHASRVILAVRTHSKGVAAAKDLSEDPIVKQANPIAQILIMELDLDDYESVSKFTKAVKETLDMVDIVLLNEGINIMSYQTSKSGHERVMQINYHSNYHSEALLALELLPLFEATAARQGTPSRLAIVGSQAENMASITKKPIPAKEDVIAYIDNKATHSGLTRNSDSKLLVSAFVQELGKRVSSSNVIINNVCPGMVATGFNANLPLWLKPLVSDFSKLRARDVEEGARALIFASAVVGEESHGELVVNNTITR